MDDEKRKFLRFECLIPVELLELGEGTEASKEIMIDNVSREGIRMVFDFGQVFIPGDNVNFTIHKPDDKRTFSISGEVVWSKPSGRKVEVGLKIDSMDKKTKADLLDLGYSVWRESQEKEEKDGEEKP